MSSKKTRVIADWATQARQLRESWPNHPSQEAFALILGVSTSEVRRWEQGARAPTPAQAILLANHSSGSDRLFWLRLAGLREEVLLPHASGTERSRISVETRQLLITALETILDRAPSTVIERVAEFLTQRAAKFGEEKE